LALVAGVFFAASGISDEKPALVTFYSGRIVRCAKTLAVSVAAGSVEMAYRGAIYDADEELIKTIAPNRFVTFQMKAGPHTLGAHAWTTLFHPPCVQKQGSLHCSAFHADPHANSVFGGF
jgi:hypothetical protein